MTRKDFQLIADAINSAMHKDMMLPVQAKMIAGELADNLARTNPRFDRQRFITACTK